MKEYELFDSLSRIDDDLIDRSNQKDKYRKENKGMPAKSFVFKRVVPVAAVFAVVISAVFGIRGLYLKNGGSNGTALWGTDSKRPTASLMKYSIAWPEIPKQVQYTEDYNSKQSEDYYEENGKRIAGNKIDKAEFSKFLNLTTQSFLSAKDGKNKVYSPANIYIALSMLASCTDKDTQAQILNVLGADSQAKAQETAVKLLKGNYVDNGSKKSLLTNSIWTGSDFSLNESFLKKLSKDYYAPIFSGDPADKKYSQAFQSWLKASTNGLLNDAAEKIKFDEQMALTLVSTLYYAANWDSEFWAKDNTENVFHSVSGDRTCTFMNQQKYGAYIEKSGFSAVTKQFSAGGRMYFILPNEGTFPESVIGSKELTDMLCSNDSDDGEQTNIKLSVPKFDISSDIDLKNSLVSLGITDAFDPEKADYSPVSPDSLYLSKIRHSARVSVDEKGVTAAAFTVETVHGFGAIEKKVNFTLDRPFIFAITADTGDVMFIGIVNEV